MAAIKYINPDTGKPEIVTGHHHSGHTVMIKMRGGGLLRASLMGFWYVEGERLRDGRYVKLVASEITNESGNAASLWRKVEPDESILAWAALGMNGWDDFGIFVMSDAKGWPVVVKDKPAHELDTNTG